MGLLARLFAINPLENPSYPINSPEAVRRLLGDSVSSSGVSVTRDTALTYGAWFRGVTLLATGCAKLPLYVYRDTGPGKERAREHAAYQLLRWKANPYQTAYQFRLQLSGHMLSTGNGYAYIVRSGDASPLELWPLDPDCTSPVRANGQVWYVTKVDGENRKLTATDVLHVKGFGFDGLVGYNLIEKVRESLGRGIAQKRYGSTYFRNSARPGIVLETPGKLATETAETLRKTWEQMHAGLDNSHRTAVLDQGLQAKVISFSARDSQLIESEEVAIRDIANFIGVPPHKLGDTSRTGYASLEQENLSYLTESLDDRLVAWEDECRDKLLTEEEKLSESHSVEYLRSALDHADRAARANYNRTALGGAPWKTRNEVRAEEGLNPLPGGDEILDPVNMGDPGGQPLPSEQGPPRGPAEGHVIDGRVLVAVQAAVTDTARRMVRRVGTHARRVGRNAKEYMAWLDTFREEHRGLMEEAYTSASTLCGAMGWNRSPAELADRTLAAIHLRLSAVADTATATTLSAEVERVVTDLESALPGWLVDWAYSDDQERDDKGQFGSGGGEGEDGGGGADRDTERDASRAEEDSAIDEAEQKDAESLESQHDKEDAKVEKERDKEDTKIEKERDKEDTKTERSREKEDTKVEKERGKEDEQVNDRQEKETETVSDKHDREDTDQSRREKDYQDLSQRHGEETKSIDDRREKEDTARESTRAAEDKQSQEKRDQEDKQSQEKRDQEDKGRLERQEAERKAVEEKHQAERDRLARERETEDRQHH